MGFDWTSGQLYDYRDIKEHIERSNPSATIVATCQFADRLTIAQQLVGGLQQSSGWSFNDPTAYPIDLSSGGSETVPGIVVNAVDIEPLGDHDSGSGQVKQAVVSITFGTYPLLPYDSGNPITICQVTSNASAEQLPLPDGGFVWPDGTPIDQDAWKPSKVFPYVELTVKVLYTAEPMLKDCTDILGQLNQDSFDLPNANGDDDSWDAGTVLFMGVGIEQVSNSEGYICYTRELKFGIRDNDGLGWNALFNPTDNQFETISSAPDPITGAGGGNPPYESGDFSTLFKIHS